MHRCLSIVEVQRAIFREVQTGPFGNATLARLARTCRIFQNAALDILWETLPSIRYLIQCLPPDLWKISIIDGYRHEIRFQRPMSSTDWEIFFRFSSRIRTISSLFQYTTPWFGQSLFNLKLYANSNVVIALSRPPSHGPLIPNLKTLCWTESNLEYVPLLQSLLARSLVDLSLPSSALRSPEMPMDLIGTRCPLLKIFCIQDDGSPSPIPINSQAIFSEIYMHLSSLESFEYHALDEVVIIGLSRIPTLVRLSGRLQNNLQLGRLGSYSTPLEFRSLESLALELGGNDLSTVASLLEIVHFSPREVSFILPLDSSSTPDELRLLFVALVNASDPERLSHISLTIPPGTTSGGIGQPISLFTIQPLLELPNVKSFTFDVECDISMDDAAIDALTERWPNLTKLSFNPSFGWGIQSGVTHRGLITLLTRCASLTEFALAVDFCEIDIPPSSIPLSRFGNEITSHCRRADFVTSVIEYPASIAAFLSDICPKLTEVTSFRDEDSDDSSVDDGYGNEWERVNEVLPGFLAVRKQYTGMSR
ncbi:hypothetical protein JVU11DRAFT_9999 [Chiua virens]|nr:hypothetical protein JVU11DRAFT_9999 [Chiua virens]